MDDGPEGPEGKGPRRAGGELIVPGAALAFTLYYFSTIWDSPWEAQVAAFLVGSVLIGLILLFALRLWRELSTGRASLAMGDMLGPPPIRNRRLAVMALTVGYLVLIDWLGFTLTSFLFLLSGMLVLEDSGRRLSRAPHHLAVSAALSLIGWAAFIYAFDARFPRGPLEALLGGLFG